MKHAPQVRLLRPGLRPGTARAVQIDPNGPLNAYSFSFIRETGSLAVKATGLELKQELGDHALAPFDVTLTFDVSHLLQGG